MVDRRKTFHAEAAILLGLVVVVIFLGTAVGRAQNNISANTTLSAKGADNKTQDASAVDDTTEKPADLEKTGVGARPYQVNNPKISGGSRDFSSGWRTFGSLLIVLALIIGGTYIFRRLVMGERLSTGPTGIEVVARNSINPKQSLCLVKLGSRMLLLGLSPNQMTALHTIDDPDEVAELTGLLEQQQPQSISNTFGKLIRQEGEYYDEARVIKGQEDNFAQERNQPWYQAKGELSSLLDKVKGLARMRFRP